MPSIFLEIFNEVGFDSGETGRGLNSYESRRFAVFEQKCESGSSGSLLG